MPVAQPALPLDTPSRPVLSVGVRIAAGFAAALLILALLTASVNARLSTATEDRAWGRHSLEVLKVNEQTFRLLLQAESTARGYQLTRAPTFRQQFEIAVTDLERSISELKRLTLDNPKQQQYIAALTAVIDQRLQTLRAHIDSENRELQGAVFAGAALMERARQLSQAIHQEDARLFQERTARARSAEAHTRQLVEYGALLAVVLTALIGWLVTRSILRPIKALSSGAARIGSGDYSQPVVVGREDELGRLAGVFNEMAARIAAREQALSEQDWMNSSLARLSRLLEGARDPARLGANLLAEFAVLFGARQSLIYVPDPDARDVLQLQASYASHEPPQRIAIGHGLIGQCYRDAAGVVLDDVPDTYLRIGSALGESKPAQVVIMPAVFEGEVKAVIELASLAAFTSPQLTLLRRFCDSFATVLHALEASQRTEQLLVETTALAEKLREQQAEMQQSNVELEQLNEELQQSNVEMEEKATVLEEQRAVIERANREIEQARTALEEKVQQLALSSKYKSDFLANMSHELRTPLNSLLILSKILAENAEGTLTPKQIERANTIHGAGNDLLELINDILDLAKIESGTVTADAAQMRMSDLLDHVRQAFTHVAENARLRFDVDVAPDVPPTITTDARRLQQILRNLLSNAFKFTAKGGVTLKIETATAGWGNDVPTLSAAKRVIAFRVIDTGIGVPEDRREIVFEAFRQADVGTSRRYGGTGLGLSISRELSRILQGALTLESKPGAGSTFTLYLPQTLTETPVQVAPPSPPASRGAARLADESGMVEDATADDTAEENDDDRSNLQPGERILLVIEDDRSFAAVLADFAREKGFKVIIERSAQDAIRAARRFRPCAITLDLLLKDSNGWAVLDRLKHDPELRHLPVHVISVENQRERALMQGAMSFLQKPVTREMLDAVLGETLALIDDPARRLLIVEDDDRQRRAVADLFGDSDVEVAGVATAAEALQALTERRRSDRDGAEAFRQGVAAGSDLHRQAVDAYRGNRVARGLRGDHRQGCELPGAAVG